MAVERQEWGGFGHFGWKGDWPFLVTFGSKRSLSDKQIEGATEPEAEPSTARRSSRHSSEMQHEASFSDQEGPDLIDGRRAPRNQPRPEPIIKIAQVLRTKPSAKTTQAAQDPKNVMSATRPVGGSPVTAKIGKNTIVTAVAPIPIA